jgi:signal transduction histidine kinase
MHIAHQWKQPLSELGSINTLITAKLKSNIKISEDEYMLSFNHSDNIIRFMTNTVNTFENFYRPSDINDHFFISASVKEVLSITSATFDFDNIEVVVDSSEDEKLDINMNELSQVLFSILSNAREIFKKREIQNPKIVINIENRKVKISDNGGGIDIMMLDKIFLPFISANGSSGMGLYLSKNIVVKNGGVISASNNEIGAIFSIEFLR